MDRRIKFRHIQCFVEIAREGSLKRAAEKLFLTQPAISKTLKELEALLGAKLMQRSRAGIALTKQGEVFQHFAEQAMANLQQGLDGIEQAGRDQKTRLSVGALPSVAAALMPDVVAECAQLAPNLSLQIMEGPHDYLIERLRLSTLDLVIGRLGEPKSMQGVSFTQLYTEEVAFVVRAGHPLQSAPDLRRLGEWQVICPPHTAAIQPLVARFLIAHGISDIPNRIYSVSGAFGRSYVRKTDAVWIISSGVVAEEVADGSLVRLPFDTTLTQGPVGMMARPDSPATPVQQIFRMAVQKVLKHNGLSSAG
ncbi:pca operon transcription factor PcaQ [Yoonia sediminilitoris]|uniref:pca operon transcription factor PcaQ n=1 Tax=Yoonia sediminilitoris TaxID=1286148 RepID=UPI001FE72692|nr:pca operon transcription factor PcaQ [Yoonia sediminilitoris]